MEQEGLYRFHRLEGLWNYRSVPLPSRHEKGPGGAFAANVPRFRRDMPATPPPGPSARNFVTGVSAGSFTPLAPYFWLADAASSFSSMLLMSLAFLGPLPTRIKRTFPS